MPVARVSPWLRECALGRPVDTPRRAKRAEPYIATGRLQEESVTKPAWRVTKQRNCWRWTKECPPRLYLVAKPIDSVRWFAATLGKWCWSLSSLQRPESRGSALPLPTTVGLVQRRLMQTVPCVLATCPALAAGGVFIGIVFQPFPLLETKFEISFLSCENLELYQNECFCR